MARLAIRATGDKSRRENVTTGDTEVIAVLYDGNRAQWTIYHHGDRLTVHNYSTGNIHTMRAHGCVQCGKETMHGDYCNQCASDIPT